MPGTSTKETLGFQAEVSQLLHLMIHSLYGNKEIFLRELVSNASDAADKLRFEAMSDAALFEDDPELRIRVGYDAEARTITVSDNGIGMSRQDVVDNIGTIAKSGTREFLAQLTADRAKDAHLIGQFGVGFYASFIVADRVTLVTRRAGLTPEHGVRWESTGEGSYTVETAEKATRGTDVILHLRPEEDELLSGYRLREILRKYSDHIAVPILMKKEQWDSEARKQVAHRRGRTGQPRLGALGSAQERDHRGAVPRALQARGARHGAPLAYTHAKVEGRQEFTLLLYLPAQAPFDLWDREHRRGVKLYVRRVFIMDDAEQLIPAYLRFVRGVVDSNDLPLNVSREILQQSKDVQAIRTAAIKRVLRCSRSWPRRIRPSTRRSGRRSGGCSRKASRRITPTAIGWPGCCASRPRTTADDAQTVSLADYVGRMKDGPGGRSTTSRPMATPRPGTARTSRSSASSASRCCCCTSASTSGWHRRSTSSTASRCSRRRRRISTSAPSAARPRAGTEPPTGEHALLLERMQTALEDRASAVRVTNRLTDSPACLVSSEDGLSTNLERLLKAAGQAVPASKPILEVNPRIRSSDGSPTKPTW